MSWKMGGSWSREPTRSCWRGMVATPSPGTTRCGARRLRWSCERRAGRERPAPRVRPITEKGRHDEMTEPLPAHVQVSPKVMVQELDGETVLLDLKSERYYGLD